MKLKIKRLNGNAILPTRANKTDAGLDIYSCADVIVPASKVIDGNVHIGQAIIPTGLSVEIPDGFYGKISGRSGLAFMCGIISFDGTIDAGYRGEIQGLLFNTTNLNYYVSKGDKIAQLIVLPCECPDLVEVDELSQTERGERGFGSTGR